MLTRWEGPGMWSYLMHEVNNVRSWMCPDGNSNNISMVEVVIEFFYQTEKMIKTEYMKRNLVMQEVRAIIMVIA